MKMDFELGQRIKLARERLGMSQEALASRLGYKSKSSITKIEKGEQRLTLSTIKEFARILGLSPNTIVGWQDPLLEDKSTEFPLGRGGCRPTPQSKIPELQRLISLAEKAPTKDINMAITVLRALKAARKEAAKSPCDEK